MAPAESSDLGSGNQCVMVDAFTGEGLRGNPAAVCVLSCEADPMSMQRVATELNVSQTAFLVKNSSEEEISPFDYELRWFSPRCEVPLCGHGTLASAYYLFATKAVKGDLIRFNTKSGVLPARKIGTSSSESFQVELDFPVMTTSPCDNANFVLTETLGGASVVAVSTSGRGDLILELSSEEHVRGLKPDFDEVLACSDFGLLVTAKASAHSAYDFVSRFFAPRFAINEDPVCGSAHCALAPYWAKKLLKNTLSACQVSERGGKLDLQVNWESMRVLMRGEAVINYGYKEYPLNI
ncbi:uncharacterized protein LOC9662362 [Selaginella moellendorffii]|uniref:uncharacterized protein LOC9662362 n=1 Tax=Selaginella moellendorffii TaxID=88036 RepID=UPI000D1CD4CC|nr:uncharacterized protein LOC9662362 [Selaginella moellendorffii]|eukprot:XP_024543710.1 uncharacterized protein LOC9662362 [Selaginella moellendorffii]